MRLCVLESNCCAVLVLRAYVCFHILVKFAAYRGIAAHSAYNMFFFGIST